MQVAKYIFQSPSTSPVQVGRLDPSSVKDDSSSAPKIDAVQAKTPEEWLKSDAKPAVKVSPKIVSDAGVTRQSPAEKPLQTEREGRSGRAERRGFSDEARRMERGSRGREMRARELAPIRPESPEERLRKSHDESLRFRPRVERQEIDTYA